MSIKAHSLIRSICISLALVVSLFMPGPSSGTAAHTVASTSLNLALQTNGGVATASSYGTYNGYSATADHANDGLIDGSGNPRTFWAASKGKIPAWLQIQLAQDSLINEIKITPYLRQMTYSLDGSLNGIDWFTIVPSASHDSSPATFDFAPVTARYVRMNVTASDAPSGYVWATETSEIEIYATGSSGSGKVFLPLIVKPLGTIQTTGAVSGTVTGLGAPIQTANVCTLNGTLCTTTDGSGHYTLENVPTGTQTVTASYGHFNPQSKSVTVTGGQTATLNFSLKIKVTLPVTIHMSYPYSILYSFNSRLSYSDSGCVVSAVNDYCAGYSHYAKASKFVPLNPFAADERLVVYEFDTDYSGNSQGTIQYAVNVSGILPTTFQGGNVTVELFDGDYGDYNTYPTIPDAPFVTFTPPGGSGAWWVVFTVDGTTGELSVVNTLQNSTP
jgi:hypothetical protein